MALVQVRSRLLRHVRHCSGLRTLEELCLEVKGKQFKNVQQKIDIGKRVVKAIEGIEQDQQKVTGKQYGLAVTITARTGNASVALSLLNKMKKQKLTPTIGTYTGIMTACEKARHFSKTIALFNDIKKLNLTADPTCFSVYLRCLAQVDGPRAALVQLQDSEFASHSYCVTALLSCLHDDCQSAIELIEATPEESLTSLCYGAAIGVCAKAGWIERACDLLQKSVQNGKGSAAATNAVISAFGRSGKWQEAVSLLDSGNVADSDSYSLAMQACIQNDELNTALQLLTTMHSNMIHPGAPTVTSLFTLCSKTKAYAQAKDVINTLPANKLQLPNMNAYLSILESQHSHDSPMYNEAVDLVKRWSGKLDDVGSAVLVRLAHDVDAVLSEIATIGEVGPRVRAAAIRHLPSTHPKFDQLLYARPASIFVFSSAIASLSEHDQWERAVSVLESMPAFNLQADVSCYNAALSACVKAERKDLTRELLTNLQKNKIQPDNGTASAMRAALRRPIQNIGSGDHAEANYIRWWRKCNWPDPNAKRIDLHGLPSDVALALTSLVTKKLLAENRIGLPWRDVLIIPGKGRHSGDKGPTLKAVVTDRVHELGGFTVVPEHNLGHVRVSACEREWCNASM